MPYVNQINMTPVWFVCNHLIVYVKEVIERNNLIVFNTNLFSIGGEESDELEKDLETEDVL